MMVVEAIEAVEQRRYEPAIAAMGQAAGMCFLIGQLSALSQCLGIASAAYIGLEQHEVAERYALAAVQVCSDGFNLAEYQISFDGRPAPDGECPGVCHEVRRNGMSGMTWPVNLIAWCYSEAYQHLGNANSSAGKHDRAIIAYMGAVQKVAGMPQSGLWEAQRAGLYCNLGNQYHKQRMGRQAGECFDKAEALARACGEHELLARAREARKRAGA